MDKNAQVIQIEGFLDANFPTDILSLLTNEVGSAQQLRRVMSEKEDSAHEKAHITDVQQISRIIGENHGLSDEELDLLRRAVELHDSGYKLVEAGILTPEQHHYGSAYIASILDPDPRVIEAVFLHNRDILPADASLIARILRDSDRIASTGFQGANRLAFYLGFSDPDPNSFDYSASDLLNSQFPKYHEDDEHIQYLYFRERVLPQLIENASLHKLCAELWWVFIRIIGGEYADGTKVEAVSNIDQDLFERRIKHTLAITDSFDESKFPLPYTEADQMEILKIAYCYPLLTDN